VENIKIAIAEDHTILREGLKSLISPHEDMKVVCEAGDGHEAIRCVDKFKPDIILLDLSMPRMNGLDAIREIKKVNKPTKVIVLTVHKTDEYVRASLQAGVDGYLLKDSGYTELLAAIRSVMGGKRYLSPEISSTLIDGYLEGKNADAAVTAWDTLSNREREIVKLIGEGHKNRDIAGLLCISIKTVEKHRANIMQKLDIHDVSGLTALAIEKGIVTR
jgi:two-component system, NarL family, response regulator NreC